MKYLDKRDNADIIEYIRRRYFIKGSACAFLSLGVLIFFYLYGFAYFAERMGEIGAAIITPVCLALPFFALKLHKDVFDKSWEGEIVSLKTHLVSKATGTRTFITREHICFTVRTEKDILLCDRPAAELARFGIGDRLRHIKGTKYLQSLRKNGVRDCVMCGAIIRESGNTCPHCGFSLVKFDGKEERA